jgi:hypothetical protein
MSTNGCALWSVLFCLTTLVACSPSCPPTDDPPGGVARTRNLPRLPGGTSWNIETIGQNNVGQSKSFDVPLQEEFSVTGWAVDEQAKAPAGGVEIVIDGTPCAAQYGSARRDVVTSLGVLSYVNSGYSLELLGPQFTPGTHSLFVRVLNHDRKAYWEFGPYSVNFK